MNKNEQTPSESEWKIMEVLWNSDIPLTSLEVIERLKKSDNMTPKMVRVLINRLSKKGLLGYKVDEQDARVYHYTPLRTMEECLRDKSRKFTDCYFSGNKMNAMAALVQSFALTDEQIEELEKLLEERKESR
ncbi:MAG: BlaI/MecI/CopY family transcriptional regulator [Lachnospira sp.]|nr:BlaI/MecI/CopY family transcriptional regulator [Lachnospira sp.]